MKPPVCTRTMAESRPTCTRTTWRRVSGLRRSRSSSSLGPTVRPKNVHYPVEPDVDPLRLGQLVEGIALRRNEAGQTSVEITYRFGPPDAPSEAHAFAVGDQHSWVNRATCASIDRLPWASNGGRRCAAH